MAPVAPATPFPTLGLATTTDTCARDVYCFDDFVYRCEGCCANDLSALGKPCFDGAAYTRERCCQQSSGVVPPPVFFTPTPVFQPVFQPPVFFTPTPVFQPVFQPPVFFTPTPVFQPSVGAGGCVDKQSVCPIWGALGECNGAAAVYTRNACPFTCNVCGGRRSAQYRFQDGVLVDSRGKKFPFTRNEHGLTLDSRSREVPLPAEVMAESRAVSVSAGLNEDDSSSPSIFLIVGAAVLVVGAVLVAVAVAYRHWHTKPSPPTGSTDRPYIGTRSTEMQAMDSADGTDAEAFAAAYASADAASYV